MSTYTVGGSSRGKTNRERGSATFWDLAHERSEMTESQRVSSIKAGLQTIWADAIKNAFEVSSPNMLVLMNLSSSTLERRRKSAQPLDLVASERLDRIASVALMAEGVFEDQEAAARWMSSSNVALGGDAPVMLCETELGARQVRRVLNALEWGGVV